MMRMLLTKNCLLYQYSPTFGGVTKLLKKEEEYWALIQLNGLVLVKQYGVTNFWARNTPN